MQIGEDQFHIDPGPGSLVAAKNAGINLRATTALLASHNHINHCNDINVVIDAMTYSGFDRKSVLVANKTVINGRPNEEPFLHKRYRDFLERFIVLEAGKKVGINDVEIVALKAKHSDPNAIGFKFITPEYTISYSGDTMHSVEAIAGYENSNVLILNVPCLNKEEDKYNLCKEDAIKIIKAVKPKLAIITHFGANFIKADPLYEVREIQKETNVQVIAATDGMIVNPLIYSVDQGQKTLYKYARKEGIRVSEYQQQEFFKDVDEVINEKQTELNDEAQEENENRESSNL